MLDGTVMCEYCEKGKKIYTKDKNTTIYVEWDDCEPVLTTAFGEFLYTIKVPIFFCPFCGRELCKLD